MLTGEKLNISGYDMWEKESLKTEDNPTPAYNLTEKKVLTAYIGDKKLDNSSESFNNIKASGRVRLYDGRLWYVRVLRWRPDDDSLRIF